MEAEYQALSIAMREVLPLLNLAKEISKGVRMSPEEKTVLKTTVWEDNNGYITLAKMEPGKMTPRSKHYGIR